MQQLADACAARTAARQWGLLTRAQALAAGISRHGIQHRLRTGRWKALQPGVYAIAGTPAAWEQTVLAAVLAAGPGAVATGPTAARLHGLARLQAGEHIDVLTTVAQTVEIAGVTATRTRRLDSLDSTTRRRVPVVTGERLLVELASRTERAELIALVDDAVCGRVTTRTRLYQRATALHRGRRGVGLLIWLTAPGAEGEFRSWLERQAARVLALGGLAAPEWNVVLHDGRGRIGVVDAVYRPLAWWSSSTACASTPPRRSVDATPPGIAASRSQAGGFCDSPTRM